MGLVRRLGNLGLAAALGMVAIVVIAVAAPGLLFVVPPLLLVGAAVVAWRTNRSAAWAFVLLALVVLVVLLALGLQGDPTAGSFD